MKKQMITLALGLLASPVVLAAGMDCSDPMHAQMGHCKSQASKVGHSKMDHSKMKPGAGMGMEMKMDHSKMKHGTGMGMKMDQSSMKHQPSIPVSDGSIEDVPMPFNVPRMEDDPVLTKLMLEQLEIHDADGRNPLTWEAEAWIGKDLNKLWFKTEGERLDGKTEEAELQALYSHAIAPYWDFQVGLRKDFQPESREWGVLGLKGLAPYFFETDLALFAGKEGRTAARLQGEYELLLTQKTILTPEIEVNLYGKDDPVAGVGSGLSDVTVGLRLRHEFKREFAPYIGVEWTKKFGNTADFARDEGVDVSDTQLVAGIRAWF